MLNKLIVLAIFITMVGSANMVRITDGTNLIQYVNRDKLCQETLKELRISSSCYEVRKIVDAFNRDPIIVATILHESNFNKYALNINKNGSQDGGIFQLNSNYYEASGNLDHEIEQAKECYDYFKRQTGLGYRCWASYNNGKYLTRYDKALLLLKNI